MLQVRDVINALRFFAFFTFFTLNKFQFCLQICCCLSEFLSLFAWVFVQIFVTYHLNFYCFWERQRVAVSGPKRIASDEKPLNQRKIIQRTPDMCAESISIDCQLCKAEEVFSIDKMLVPLCKFRSCQKFETIIFHNRLRLAFCNSGHRNKF